MKKEQGNIWQCKTRFTFYLNPKDEKKLLNYSVSGKFNSFEDCNKAKEILTPLGHHGLIYECQWHNHSNIFYFTHASKHKFYVKSPLRRPDNLTKKSGIR